MLAATNRQRTRAESMLAARPEIGDDPWARLGSDEDGTAIERAGRQPCLTKTPSGQYSHFEESCAGAEPLAGGKRAQLDAGGENGKVVVNYEPGDCTKYSKVMSSPRSAGPVTSGPVQHHPSTTSTLWIDGVSRWTTSPWHRAGQCWKAPMVPRRPPHRLGVVPRQHDRQISGSTKRGGRRSGESHLPHGPAPASPEAALYPGTQVNRWPSGVDAAAASSAAWRSRRSRSVARVASSPRSPSPPPPGPRLRCPAYDVDFGLAGDAGGSS